MNTVNMARLSRCAIFLTSPLDSEALNIPLGPECYSCADTFCYPCVRVGPFLIGGSDGTRTAPSRVTGRGAVVIVINSDRCGVFLAYWDRIVLVAGFAEVIC
jgi:hypothetical protein